MMLALVLESPWTEVIKSLHGVYHMLCYFLLHSLTPAMQIHMFFYISSIQSN